MNISLRSLALGLGLLVMLSGCANIQEMQSRHWTKRLAAKAYKADPGTPRKGPVARDFERGWREGYYDVARGSDGQPPLLPPQSYWTFKYQNCEGAQKIASWYEGYLLGANAAHEDGIGQFNVIPTSPLKDCGVCSANRGCQPCQCGAGQGAAPGGMPAEPVIEYVAPPMAVSGPALRSLPPVGPETVPPRDVAPVIATAPAVRAGSPVSPLQVSPYGPSLQPVPEGKEIQTVGYTQ